MRLIALISFIFYSFISSAYAQNGTSNSQTFQGLRIIPYDVSTSRNGEVQVVLKLVNVTSESVNGDGPQTIAVAFRADGSGGLADFWKINPRATAQLRDQSGNQYYMRSASGLKFGIGESDWIFLNPGGSIPVTYNFSGGNAGQGQTFSFSAELHVVWPTASGMRNATFQVYFPNLNTK